VLASYLAIPLDQHIFKSVDKRSRSTEVEMVNLDIPSSYTFSPSEGTPHLTINREATIDLDSSNAFEGNDLSSPFDRIGTDIDRTREIARGLVCSGT
jgi:S-adenosylmethionine decarboxylase